MENKDVDDDEPVMKGQKKDIKMDEHKGSTSQRLMAHE
jgi:hypothetical protein